MDFELTTEQTMLRDTVRSVLARHYTHEHRAQVIGTDPGWDPQVWSTFAEIGLLGLTISAEDGGMGAGPIETMLVLEELGRVLAPEPVLDCALLPGALISRAGSQLQRKQILPEVASGERRIVFAHGEPGLRPVTAQVTTQATLVGDGWQVSGRKHPVAWGDCADQLIVSAALPDGGTGLFLIEPTDSGVTVAGYRTHDGRRGADLTFDRATAVPLGAAVDAGDAIADIIVTAQAALGAEAIGAMSQALRLTTEYLSTRKQFGVPLRSFQTLTQRAADMYVSLELARSMSLYASMSLADGVADPVVAARAKLRIGRSGRHIGQEAIQMHGGIGMTAEYPVGHYTARLTAIEHTLGDSGDHLRYLAGHVADHQLAEI
ncbi:acyl-CoA dehydrogenase [Nocardia sp. MH4]|uniref:acyl-CoA dehydrogenase family protein n=1 Tax=Nocardia TaxID=1817 RepID=UPI001C4F651D|nr:MULTISPECIES: acyl-CoA dehydrogenase family protein [Nocardia]MBW0273839.1 acyl-CoA dehydrogenase [Nocardia sp. MH4]